MCAHITQGFKHETIPNHIPKCMFQVCPEDENYDIIQNILYYSVLREKVPFDRESEQDRATASAKQQRWGGKREGLITIAYVCRYVFEKRVKPCSHSTESALCCQPTR